MMVNGGEAVGPHPVDEQQHAKLPHATVSDMAHLQRATASHMVPVRELGRGAFAAVELVSMPVAGKRKLLVCKKLLTEETIQQQQQQSAAVSSQQLQEKQQQEQPQQQQLLQQSLQQLQLQAPPPFKASSLQDWSREVTMHRETAGCPFVLQLLAAKKCRAGNMLLLTEYAAAGSLTDVLARMRLQQKVKRDQQEHAMRRCASAAAVLQHQQQQQGSEDFGPALEALDAPDPSVLCATNSDSVAALCDALREGHAPTAMLIHGIDVDVAAYEALQAAAADGAAAGSRHHHHHHLEHVGLCEESARFYSACILMGLQWLHSRRILHRDIKPCNLLLFSDGYLKLADLGCCCLLPPGIDSARTRTGTSEYMAPEVVDSTNTDGYSFPVDMWSLGVTLWQMVAGDLPAWAEEQQHHHHHHHHYHVHRSAKQQQEQHNGAAVDARPGQQGGCSSSSQYSGDDLVLPLEPAAMHRHTTPKDLKFPEKFSKELCDLLTGLLKTDSAARLSIPEVQATSWFQGFDWQALQDKTLPPPMLPAHVLAHKQQP